MKIIFAFSAALFASLNLLSQNTALKPKYSISFAPASDKKDTIRRNSSKESLWTVELRSSDLKNENLKDYTLEISTDGSTLPKDHFEIVSSPNGKLLSELENSSTVRVIIKKESEEFKQAKPLELILKILVKRKVLNNMVADEDSNNVGKPKEIRLTLLKAEEPIPTYNYLGYLGTNFDLVDGVQAKNLFFATNIFIPSDTKWGFSLGLYG
ncbi:MAG: hypothetical protein EOP53_27025, partial [Sphingobacteriales bacterium]